MAKLRASPLLWLSISALVLVLDQLTKWMVIARFRLGDSEIWTSYFNLVRVHNEGAAFSFLSNAVKNQRCHPPALGIGADRKSTRLNSSH